MPDHISSLTPAWDPLSHTPTRYSHSYFSWPKPTNKIYRTVDPLSLTPIWSPPEDQHLATSSQITSNPTDRPQRHPLLDEWLVGSSLKVVIDNGKSYKNQEVTVSIAKVDGVFSIRHNTLKGLAPAWVSPKSPNPTCNNSILMVVKGNHCGKYVRRIHHRYHEDNGDKQVIILLAVINKVEGAADMLTGEQFNLALIHSV